MFYTILFPTSVLQLLALITNAAENTRIYVQNELWMFQFHRTFKEIKWSSALNLPKLFMKSLTHES